MSDIVLEIKNLTRRFGALTSVESLTLVTTTILIFIGARLYPHLAT